MTNAARFFLFVLGLIAILPAPGPSFASEDKCKNVTYTAPPGVTILSEKEILARVIGYTQASLLGDFYLDPNGDYVFQERRNRNYYYGKWYICGFVFIWEITTGATAGRKNERLFSISEEGKLSVYHSNGSLIITASLQKGKTF